MISIFQITDYNDTRLFAFEHAPEVNALKAFYSACNLAEKGEEPCSRVSIPEKYLRSVGLTRVNLPIYNLPDLTLKKTPEEERGFMPAACYHCYSFEEGTCNHYGGTCDPYETDCDKVHSSNVFSIFVNGKFKGSYYMEHNFSPKEILGFLGCDPADEIKIKETV